MSLKLKIIEHFESVLVQNKVEQVDNPTKRSQLSATAVTIFATLHRFPPRKNSPFPPLPAGAETSSNALLILTHGRAAQTLCLPPKKHTPTAQSRPRRVTEMLLSNALCLPILCALADTSDRKIVQQINYMLASETPAELKLREWNVNSYLIACR